MMQLILLRAALCFCLLALAVEVAVGAQEYNRHDFPSDFIFGASTAAYQVEGAAFEDGRTASIFDTFAHAGYVAGNGDIACDEYHKYKEDVQLMVNTRLDAYRFSISWSRLIPNGRGDVNPKGLEYYNNLINELILHGIQPHVTLVHFDVPQVLEDEYGGFINRTIIDDFTAYADVCFREFGDRVQHWTTVNEANIFIMGGYNYGNSPPGRCSPSYGAHCTVGNSTTEPYLAAHHVLLAHASAARLYKEKYQAKQQGFVGVSLYSFHFIPYTNRTEDIVAAQRSYDFFVGWFMHPLTSGDYPEIMKRNVGTRLPTFTKNESELVKGSFDFIGLNYYTIAMAQDDPTSLMLQKRDYVSDMAVLWIYLSSPLEGNPYLDTPWGLQGVLDHFKQAYNNPPIFIHENGQMTPYNESVNDPSRVEYLQSHIGGILDAVRNGSNTKGYFVWSFMDVLELLYGYKSSFGLYYVDLNDPELTRYPKLSQKWYSRFLKGENATARGKENQSENVPQSFRINPVDVGNANLFRYPQLHQHQSS